MKNFLFFTLLFSSAIAYAASPIIGRDSGTYVVIGKDGKPSNLYYRLSQYDGKWKMEGKEADGAWKNISCEQSCEYKLISDTDAAAYLPQAMREKYDIACIANIAQAFCRYTLKLNSSQGGYVVIALVTGQPVPIFLKRMP